MTVFSRAVAACILGLCVASATTVSAYLKLGVVANDRVVTLKWSKMPIRYFVTDRGIPGVTGNELQSVLSRAFERWHAVQNASVAYEFVGFTSALPEDEDGQSTIGFLSRPELQRVLASTSFLVDEITGEVIESDIFFNAAFPWSIAASGEANRYDLETIAVHEIGHLNGLGHSALGETDILGEGRRLIAADTVMFPIAYPPGTVSDRALRADDIAGISDLYPKPDFTSKTGSFSGRVIKNGKGVFGAHVTAFNPATGKMVGGFTLNDEGQFSIGGLSPGPHVVRVEPLDDSDVDSYFDVGSAVDLNFRVTFLDRLVVVPRGGDSGAVDIVVAPR